MAKARRAGIATPTLYLVDCGAGRLVMELIDGWTAKQAIVEKRQELGTTPVSIPRLTSQPPVGSAETLAHQIGQLLARLHGADIVHGDLTTSNILVERDTGRLVLIDFGLSQVSPMAEDKAVDLYVLERAILSTHPEEGPRLFCGILAAYSAPSAAAVLTKLAEGAICCSVV